MSIALLFDYLLLNMFRMLVHPSSGACELLWIYFICCMSLVRCVLVFRRGYLMLNVFRMLGHPSSGACDLFVELFLGLYCSGSMCVGVTVWFGWGGVVSLCRLKHSLLSLLYRASP